MRSFPIPKMLRKLLPLFGGIAGVIGQGASGATLIVYNNNDLGAGSLRQAIADNRNLGGGNTIVFSDTVKGTITLTAGELVITNDVVIQGPGRTALTVSG